MKCISEDNFCLSLSDIKCKTCPDGYINLGDGGCNKISIDFSTIKLFIYNINIRSLFLS